MQHMPAAPARQRRPPKAALRVRARAKRAIAPTAGPSTRPITLALQGGGTHGAFAWGVLDRLLEDRRLRFEGISATSAGAMNAIVLAQGMLDGGPDRWRERAREALHDFWRAVSQVAQPAGALGRWPGGTPWGAWGLALGDSPLYWLTDLMLRVFSPYQFNPCNFNPLHDVLHRHVDFERLRREPPCQLFLCATNVETGKIRIFTNRELCIEAVLASACLPNLFQAVEIDGEHYWDGGYVGNPAIYPLIGNCHTRDVVIVPINAIARKGVPRTVSGILNRVSEVSFNSSLMREMRAISFVNSLVRGGKVAPSAVKEVLVHAIRSDESMTALGASSRLDADWHFLCGLRERGREAARAWLAASYGDLGRRSSMDVGSEFL